MEIIKIHYNLSKPVVSYREIKKEASEMKRFILRPMTKGLFNKAYAIAHAQVSETPYAFFVLSPECVVEKLFESDVIINPQIISAPLYKQLDGQLYTGKTENDGKQVNQIPNALDWNEPCLSFPFRQPKRITRYDRIEVEYQIPGWFGLKKIRRWLTGVASEIYQHEYDHTKAENIYFQSEAPVKWWELTGNKKPVGGVSLDQFDPTGLVPSKEKERVIDNFSNGK
jgi:hypothetical protein